MMRLRMPRFQIPTIALAALLGMASVALGAFGAHALKGILDATQESTYETATTYQMWHALALLAIGTLESNTSPNSLLQWSRNLMLLGTLIFSGSLYLLVLTGVRGFGFLTPLGGSMLLLAWCLLALSQRKWDKKTEI